MGGHHPSIRRFIEPDAHTVFSCAILHIIHIVAIVVIGIQGVCLAIDGEDTRVVGDTLPIIVGIVVHLIATDEIAAGHVPIDGIATGIAATSHRNGSDTRSGRGRS